MCVHAVLSSSTRETDFAEASDEPGAIDIGETTPTLLDSPTLGDPAILVALSGMTIAVAVGLILTSSELAFALLFRTTVLLSNICSN
jgi:hypothetical protein